jgi:uncharacterized integral membrane protein (TIGR00697 family)
MKKSLFDRVFTMDIQKSKKQIISVLFCFLIGSVMQNILVVKTFQFYGLPILGAGIILTWFVFACSDILTECMGEKFAFRACLGGVALNLAWSAITWLAITIKGDNDYVAECYALVLGSSLRITLSSAIAYIGGSYLNNHIMDKLHKRHGERKYYLRAILSTGIGQLFDDYVFWFLAFAPFGWSALEKSWEMIAFLPILSAVAETIIEAIITPVSKKVAFTIKAQQAIDRG